MKRVILLFIACIWICTSQAQTRQISGKVTDSTGETLIGASVTIKGTTTGTTTDVNGAFRMNVPASGNVVLQVRYVGYKTQDVSIGNQAQLNITLETDANTLQEVTINIGYGTVSREALTGSVSSVRAKDLKDIPINSAAEALAGRLAGVQVTAAEGAPGADVKIRVRGGGSITQDNSPLYVVDGIQIENALDFLSPQDIESIDVLKDASSTAIYGARGSNGVVLITTKGGKEMKTRVTYNGLVGQRRLANKLGVMDPYDYVLYQYERSRGGATTEADFLSTYGTYQDLDLYKGAPFIDWQDLVFGRNAMMQTHNIAVAGGTKATTFNISLTKNKEEGVMINSDFDRNLINFKLDHTVSDKFKVGIGLRYNNQTVNGAGTASEGSSSTNRLRHSVKYQPFQTNPNLSIYELDEAYYQLTNSAGNNVGAINPIVLSNAEYRKEFTRLANINGYFNYDFTKYLSLRSTAGVDYRNIREDAFDDKITPNARINNGFLPTASVENTTNNAINWSNVLSFNSKSFGNFSKNHSVDALVGAEIYQLDGRNLETRVRSLPDGITPEKALGQLGLGASVPNYPSTVEDQNRVLSFFSRANYSYKQKYLATLSLRADGSTKFASDRRWGYFPSASLAWRLSEENFIKNISEISNLKLRLSYGEAGNNRINSFLYLTNFSASPNAVYALNNSIVPTFTSSSLANSLLKWETTISRNVGLDIGLLNNRFTLSTDVYQNDTKDLLINVPIPSTSGYTNQLQNIGRTRNTGVEFQLNAGILEKKDFSWNANFNISFNKNKIVQLSRFQDLYYESSGWGVSGQLPDFIVQKGKPVGTMYGFVTDGYYTVNDFNYNTATQEYTLKPGVANSSAALGGVIPQPGGLKLRDLSGDGSVDKDNDREVIGNANPDFIGGLNQSFNFKGFDLSVFMNFVVGGDVLNANKLEFTNSYNVSTNMLDVMNDRWKTIDGNGTVIQRVSGNQVFGIPPDQLAAANANATLWQPIRSGNGAYVLHSWAVEDGSFLRINNVTLGYTLPKSLTNRIKVNSLRLYGTVNNLAVFTKYSGFDPEVNARRSTPVTPNVDYSAYPRSRAFIFGVNLGL